MRNREYSFSFSRALFAAIALLLAAHAHALLPIQHWQTPNGVRVYFVESHELPMVDVSVDFPAGSGFDTPDKSGVAMLTQHLLKLGAAGLDDDDIARRLADVGAQLGGRFDNDRGGLALRTLKSADAFQRATDVLAAILQKPEFPAPVLEREKARVIGAIRESDTKPETILGRTFNRLIYASHPYGLRSSGEVDTVIKITRDDLAAFYRSNYASAGAVVAIMGDLTRAEAEALAEKLTSALPPGAAPAQLPPVETLKAAAIRVAGHPATQSHLLIGAPAISRRDPDYFPLFVGNYILGGGGFVSRITEEVREKRGLAYSAYSYFSPMKERGPFVIGLQTRKDQVGEALAIVRRTLKEFVERGPTDDELKRAKQNLVGGFPLRIDSNRKIMDYLATIGFYQLPLTYLDDFIGNIEKVTAGDIRAAFVRHVDPERMATVVVGPADEAALTPKQ